MPALHLSLVEGVSIVDLSGSSDDDPMLSFNAESERPSNPTSETSKLTAERTVDRTTDGSMAFTSERSTDQPEDAARAPASARTTAVPAVAGGFAGRRAVAGGAAIAVVALAVVLTVILGRSPANSAPLNAAASDGIVDVTSQPTGAGITIDGQPRGVTPLRLTLTVGPHVLDVIAGGVKRSLPVTATAGTVVSQHVEFALAAAPTSGRLEITTDSPGARAAVDGLPQGTIPLAIDGIAPGEHWVTISRAGVDVDRVVTIEAGATATLVANAPAADNTPGWVRIRSPIELQVFEAGRRVGTTATDRLILPPGRHELNLSNEPFEFHATVRLDVVSGRTVSPPVALPNGILSINAFPWAEVAIDGRPSGITPLGNLPLPIGLHEVVWRHPQLGERRQTIALKASSPVGVGMDLTK